TRSKRYWSSDVCSSDLGGGTAQVVTLMGRAFHSIRDHSARIVSSHSDGWHRSWELLEYRTPQKVLSLAVSQNCWGDHVLCKSGRSEERRVGKEIKVCDD